MQSINKLSRIYVTGGRGFLGRKILTKLDELGYRYVFSEPKNFNLENPLDCSQVFEAYKPDVVLHLAAQIGGITYNLEHQADILLSNVNMNKNIVENCHRNGCKLVSIGSVCEYPSNAAIPFKEENVFDGTPEESNRSYGISKRLLYELGLAFNKQFGLQVIHPLLINLFGDGDKYDPTKSHVIAAIIKKVTDAKLSGSKEITLFGNGSPTRDFIHVDDAASAIIFLMENYDGIEPINVGSGAEYSIKYIAESICAALDYDGDIVWDTSKPNGQMRRSLDVTNLTSLGWKPSLDFGTALKKTANDYFEMRKNEEE